MLWVCAVQPSEVPDFGIRYGIQIGQAFGYDFGYGAALLRLPHAPSFSPAVQRMQPDQRVT